MFWRWDTNSYQTFFKYVSHISPQQRLSEQRVQRVALNFLDKSVSQHWYFIFVFIDGSQCVAITFWARTISTVRVTLKIIASYMEEWVANLRSFIVDSCNGWKIFEKFFDENLKPKSVRNPWKNFFVYKNSLLKYQLKSFSSFLFIRH